MISNSAHTNSFIYIQLNDFKHCNVIPIIQFFCPLLNISKYSYLTQFYLVLINCLHTLKWLQILLSYINSFIYTQLNVFKLTSVICLHTVKCSNSYIWSIDGTLTDTILGQSEPGSNSTEGILHIPQSSRTGASPSDSLMSYPGCYLELSRSIELVTLKTQYINKRCFLMDDNF